MIKKTITDMNQIAAKRQGCCLSSEYLGAKTPLQWQCFFGHQWSASPVNITSRNSWCPYCAGQKSTKTNIEHMRKMATERGGDCLSTEYTNSKTRLIWRCSKMHTWEAIPLNVINKGTWCPACAKNNDDKHSVCITPKRAKKPNQFWNVFHQKIFSVDALQK